MGCGLWAAAQRPFNAPLNMYGQSEHLIIFRDGDQRSVERYGQIGGGIDRDLIEQIVNQLRKHEFLYIGKNMGEDGVSPALAIVSAN
jgi:hypothetical protein